MSSNPALIVMNICGYYDLVCSYYGNEVVAGRLEAGVKARVSVKGYGAGHATYTDDAVRLEIKRDVAAFVQRAIGPPQLVPSPAAQPSTPAAAADGAPATTQHSITINGRRLRYTATAGLLPIRVNDTGEPHGQVFFVAYTAAAPQGTRRPLTFLWNGGPGSNATLLHLVGFGPKRLADSRGAVACVECEIEDNDATWLEQSDLVFVDPVGTGFSRPTRAEYGAEFYNTLGDIASIAEFVRVYLTRFDAWDAPLFIAGESYGAWRASGVAETLEQRGMRVAGVMVISGGIHVGPVIDDDLRTALFIPTRAAAAFHHQKLGADLQKDLPSTLRTIETWARNEYAPALKRAGSLSDQERDAIAGALARYTGLEPALIDRNTLVVGRQQFAEQLLREPKRVLARFDTRQVEGRRAPGPSQRDGEPLPASGARVQDRPGVSGQRRRLHAAGPHATGRGHGGALPSRCSGRRCPATRPCQRFPSVAAAAWWWSEIAAAVPTVFAATQESFVPQMINFEVLGGVNFKKGCYPGQEIVARSQYLGKLKRRMQVGHAKTAPSP